MKFFGSEEETLQLVMKQEKERKILQEIALSGLAEETLILANESQIHDNFNNWQNQHQLSSPCFDVFRNSNKCVLKLLSDLGCNFLCRSKNDINSALDAGLSGNQLIFDCQVALSSHLKLAAENDVHWIIVRQERMLNKVANYIPNAKIILSIDKAMENVSLANSAISLGLQLSGLAISDPDDVELIHQVIETTKKNGHPKLTVFDCGSKENDSLVQVLREKYKGLKFWSNASDSLLEGSFTMMTRILGKRTENHALPNGSMKSTNVYVLNEGVYGVFSGQLIEELPESDLKPVDLFQQFKPSEKLTRSKFLGPSGDEEDVIGGRDKTFWIPSLSVGDWLIFENMPSYCMSPTTTETLGFHNSSGIELQATDEFQRFWIFLKAKNDTV